MFKWLDKLLDKATPEEKPSWFNHVPQKVEVGDVRKFRSPSDGCYDTWDRSGNQIHLLISTMTVLNISNGIARCRVDWERPEEPEKDFVLGYLERGTLKVN